MRELPEALFDLMAGDLDGPLAMDYRNYIKHEVKPALVIAWSRQRGETKQQELIGMSSGGDACEHIPARAGPDPVDAVHPDPERPGRR
eukprot:SAG22_NODE_731_length_7588_cov_6.237281_3_plen_88_part_00